MCVIGADKWHQLHDLAFYDGSEAARDAALARLPIARGGAPARRAGSADGAMASSSSTSTRRSTGLVDRRARRPRRVARPERSCVSG